MDVKEKQKLLNNPQLKMQQIRKPEGFLGKISHIDFQ
jgi:hypothetical protein